MYNEVRIGKHLSDNIPTRNVRKEGGALLPFLPNFAIECAIRKAKQNQMGLKLSGTRQLLVYAVDVNLSGNNIDTIKKTQRL
jgi:hypothetical protein